MPGLLKIDLPSRSRGSARSFDIGDLLALISDEGPHLIWSVFPSGEGMEIMGDTSVAGMENLAFCGKVDASETGVILPWRQLVDLAAAIQQTIWGTYIGCRSADDFTALSSLYLDEYLYLDRASPKYYETVRIALQAIDSSYWLIYVHDDDIVQRFQNAFQHVETLKSW